MKWVNPTGLAVRGTDPMGSGEFGASRGDRAHKGTDYTGIPGQVILAVCTGEVVKIGHVYGDDLSFRYIALKSEEGHHVRHLYVKPSAVIAVGVQVIAGEEIGTLQALHGRYPQITNHCHIDIKLDGVWVNPEGQIV